MLIEADIEKKEVEDGNVEEEINHMEDGNMNNIVMGLKIKRIMRNIMKIEEGEGEYKEEVDFKVIEVIFKLILEPLI